MEPGSEESEECDYLRNLPHGKIDPEGVWEASGEAGWVKRLFLRNEAKKSFEINSSVIRRSEAKPIKPPIAILKRYFRENATAKQ